MRKPLFLLFISFAMALASPSRADEVYTFVVKKQEEKAKNRWYMTDWLETKEKMRLMDLWLAIHTPSPYEYFIRGSMQPGLLASTGRYSGTRMGAAGYASIFGIEYERNNDLETRDLALLHLRAFGYHYQGTHLRLEAGLQQLKESQGYTFRNAIAGIGLNAYITHHFGISGSYRHAFAATPNASQVAFDGNRYEGGAFIDFSFLRLYGNYLHEEWNQDPHTGEINATRTGPEVGLQLFL